MRIIRLFLATLLLIPLTTIAQERSFNQKIYLLSTGNGTPYEDLASGCEWAAPYVPTEIVGGGIWELYSLVTNEKMGTLKNGGELVGELWICVGSIEPREDPALGTVPERVVAFVIAIGNSTYGALGSWSPKTPANVPEAGMASWGGGAVVVSLTEDGQPDENVGAMMYSLLDNLEDIQGYREDVIITLRLFEPRNAELEAALEGFIDMFD